jgi:hypothetical protein
MKKVQYVAGLAGVVPLAAVFVNPAAVHAARSGGITDRMRSRPGKLSRCSL